MIGKEAIVVATPNASARTINKPIDKDSNDFVIFLKWSGNQVQIAIDLSERITTILKDYAIAEEISDALSSKITELVEKHQENREPF